ncbi:hypothetical protein ASPZODRAFT_134714 [Penicilliopsis zonata CBS 506.65]|uniref:Uncharacterized protein n=1 Tax=Penicilliopsis zonata CBS 506.65 TaxID=1073090 RepID=A0A1L9SBW0_9EURO|nr:hypothetical protein ASPZODRAFT_134714 [Penicilliopsis zonata CBS 506.65]OJJ44632.1 hypothetical protein ASPZODRAFT_134714 [Penicilliopsis zonata CBS 506.65]
MAMDSSKDPVETTSNGSVGTESYLDIVKRQARNLTNGETIEDLQQNISSLADESVARFKQSVGTSDPGEMVKQLGEKIHSAAVGSMETIEKETGIYSEDHERIDKLEDEKVEDFLKENHKSTSGVNHKK